MTVDHRADSSPCAGRNPVRPRRSGDRPCACTASLDAALTVTAADADFYTWFNRGSADTCGHSLYELLHPGAPALLGHHFARLAQGHSARFTEPVLALRTPDELLPGQLTGTAVHPPSGPVGYVVTFTPDRVLRPGTARRRAHHLSPTGARILEGIAAGASTDQLASRLCLSRQGVVYHVTGMMRALDAPNRAALVARAQFLGLLTVGTWPPRVVPECVHETGHRRQAQGGRPHDGAIGGRPGR